MPDSTQLMAMIRTVIQEELKPVHQELEELKPVRQELQELKHGQERLESKVDKLELRMENEVIEKVRALFDGFTLRGEQIENLQKHLDQRLDSIEINTGYLVSKVARLEKMAK
jgi:predicted nuclease with TOPRIM domain